MVDEPDADLKGLGLGSAIAAVLVVVAALFLAGLPAAVALRVLPSPGGWVGSALGSLGAALLGVKLIAMAWAIGTRLARDPGAGAAVVCAD